MDKDKLITKQAEDEAESSRNLPFEIIILILSWLPVKALLRFRCVCKEFYSLTTKPYFVDMHLTRSKEKTSFVIQNRVVRPAQVQSILTGRSELYFVKEGASEDGETKLVRHSNDRYVVIMLASCNGLVCFKSTQDHWDFVHIKNFATRKSITLPKGTPSYTPAIHGFGFDPTNREYKVFRLFQRIKSDTTLHCEVYILGTSTWRDTGTVVPFTLMGYETVLVNGMNYWWIKDEETPKFLGLDIRDEEFHVVLPPKCPTKLVIYGGILVELKGNLALCTNEDFQMNMWVLKDFRQSFWIRHIRVLLPTLFQSIATRNDELLLAREQNLVLYDTDFGTSKDINICNYGPFQLLAVLPYAESLVSCEL